MCTVCSAVCFTSVVLLSLLLISEIVTRLIVIDITPLTVFYNTVVLRCFTIARSLICNCPLLKGISFSTKCLLVWCD